MSTPLVTSERPTGAPTPAPLWSDELLVAGLLAGEAAAARALYEHLRPTIDRTLSRLLRHRGHDFEDLVQNCFERILRNLAEDRFEGRSSMRTWASAIASHVALDALRSRQRNRGRNLELPDQDTLRSKTVTEPRLESLNELARVQLILADMKPNLAETLILHDVLGYQLNEISEMRATTPSATQARLHRARKELKRRAASSIPARQVSS